MISNLLQKALPHHLDSEQAEKIELMELVASGVFALIFLIMLTLGFAISGPN